MPKLASRARAWCFTLHTDVVSLAPFGWSVLPSSVKFLICQKEVAPTTGALHWQGYLVLTNPKSLQGMKAISATAHWEIANGSAEQNITYCTKEASRAPGAAPLELGERPAQGS